jgi:ubiquinone/menaquinone biosynthesis C-methylase UbiE
MCAYKPSRIAFLLDPLLERTFGRRRFARLVQYLDLKGNERIMDFGSGPGVLSMMIATKLEKGGGRVTCLDVTEGWMRIAKKRLGKMPNVDFIFGDIRQTSIPENSYDGIVINYVIHDINKEDRKPIVTALSRILVKGGRIFIREPVLSGHGMPSEELRGLMRDCGLDETKFELTKPRLTATYTKK